MVVEAVDCRVDGWQLLGGSVSIVGEAGKGGGQHLADPAAISSSVAWTSAGGGRSVSSGMAWQH
jgi:hypothetical protein